MGLEGGVKFLIYFLEGSSGQPGNPSGYTLASPPLAEKISPVPGHQIDMGEGGGGGLHGHSYLFRKGDGKLYFFSHQDRPSFHHALWPFIYFTHFPHKNIYLKKIQSPKYSNGGPSVGSGILALTMCLASEYL